MHKFVLGENPQAPDTGGLWITKLTDPVAIIEAVLVGEKIHSKKSTVYRTYKYRYTDGVVEEWQLRLHFTAPTANDQFVLKQLLDDAWHWYLSYLIFEDKNIDDEQQISLN
ncbi:MAG: hypothetical protein SFU21_04615 [Flavihumibacter sp.]|nr:hypothetical protein [Flavihumibacter sp.]